MKQILVICLLLLFSFSVFGQVKKSQEEIKKRIEELKIEQERIRIEADKALLKLHSDNPNWVYLFSSDTYFIFYAPNSVISHGDSTKVWTKLVARTVERYRIRKEETGKLKDKAFVNHLSEFDCSNRKVRTLSMIFYDRDSNVLDSIDTLTDWTYIAPDTLQKELMDKVCERR